ncbi:MAG TPA: 2-dehydropantoate 2-reductase N-terminal domain-containing protein [Bacillota bacterium]|nr:2-dehydropantoate 2-reductase N-terminal domain-containing protein [Bacillota bacterium]
MKCEKSLKILFYGAGVIGSLYASRLSNSGHEVTVLARGKRFQELQEYGIVIQKVTSTRPKVTPVTVVETLGPDDDYDLIVVPVRREQLPAIIPHLAVNKKAPSILIMVNNPLGYDDLQQALGERVCIGFPGAGGERDGFLIRYSLAPRLFQPTTFGEINRAPAPGEITSRIKLIGALFREAGFPVALCRNIDAWQKTHVAWVCPVAEAIYQANGNVFQLAIRPELIHKMLRAIRENFRILEILRIPITPKRIKIWLLPEFILTPFLMILFRTRFADNIIAKHANSAKEEMEQLAAEFASLASQAKEYSTKDSFERKLV